MARTYKMWSAEFLDKLLNDIALCATTREALKKNKASTARFYKICKERPDVERRYREAVKDRARLIEDRAYELALDLKSERMVEFLLRKHMPEVYGDEINNDIPPDKASKLVDQQIGKG